MALSPRIVAAYIATPTLLTAIAGRQLDQWMDPRNNAAVSVPLTTTTYLVLGFNARVGGLWLDVGTANAVANVIVLATLQGNGQWASLGVGTDGSASGGATLAVDGHLTWTTPSASAWPAVALRDAGAPYNQAGASSGEKLHWMRLSVDTDAVTAGTSLTLIGAMHRDAAIDTTTGHSGYFKATTEYTIPLSGWVGGLEARAQDASAGTIRFTWLFKGQG
jgi:hypothetical protein